MVSLSLYSSIESASSPELKSITNEEIRRLIREAKAKGLPFYTSYQELSGGTLYGFSSKGLSPNSKPRVLADTHGNSYGYVGSYGVSNEEEISLYHVYSRK